MKGKLTGIVLGAGASYCYSEASCGIPTQQDIIGRLFFGAHTSSGEGFPSFTDTFGLRHSFGLARYLRSKFDIPEKSENSNSKMDYWSILQHRGLNLESLYAEIENDPDASTYLADFEAIVRNAVLSPTGERQANQVCKYHRMLCEALEPGDYIIDFNWDTVMSDALLYHSHFWFPSTGFGVPIMGTLLPKSQKSCHIDSLVALFHIHGSSILFERHDVAAGTRAQALYVGPKQWSPGTGLIALAGLPPDEISKKGFGPKLTRENEDRIAKGWIVLQGKWFRPIFVPPSRHKPQYSNWYCSEMRRRIHSLLPDTKQLIIAGYSFPSADTEYLSQVFVDRILHPELEVKVVNQENQDVSFQERVSAALPTVQPSYPFDDFREFCKSLAAL
ncbi:MAG TPA: hypothetical protein ENJ35_11175 [Gammaproteobacteria bacterium]|nr:hypothetical protein [Gammaproteobacteria bacterium]